ncbi:quaternary amine ABC transporter ATP-binding protein [Ligilactobacillus animalis]|uniref:Quaternary amine transport ATP-binding protein n=1 Tax=Ligilactobacillus animalis TaxID=1605 RepID=A0AAJ6FRF7_9LACO|nr:glycine betaine/L-proline ABC transporter ATP-binding protein [Ligilactobacillus animalis]KRM57621.1 glycine betaine L-proline ABC transporter ATPase [Ligilactobacillus animalis KCTC 3501 = DSM 20602]OCX49386.1 glycine betaine/L-proline ABC transporter ATP-binding protein [Ligilactobacillus animalis]QHQ70515.1 betaine/proline/choline family ABC transporter ATP-binding protein [Ligilactobacillus animalis]WHQ79800.1 glycine betaine/L-proline ABC transporter ATP-binding protein [Ligilactobacill
MTVEIDVRNVSKIFGRQVEKAEKLAAQGLSKEEILKKTGATVGVDRVSFQIEKGEIFVIMGLSGSGKSTVLRMLNQLIPTTSGQIIVDGQDLTKLTKKELLDFRRNKMSMVFQDFALFPHYTVLENVAYGLEIKNVSKEERLKKAQHALELVGLKGYGEQYPDQLSGGMQQRVGLARALASDAQVLLMDEAFSALDPLNRKEMQDELLRIQAELNKTIVFISHDLNEALKLGNHIMIMRNAKLVQVGTPEEILTSPADDYVEKFIEDVDRSRILTAENVMISPAMVNIEKAGPRTALREMRENHTSSIYLVDSKYRFKGIASAQDVSQCLKAGKTDLYDVIQTDVPTTTLDTVLTDLLADISTTTIPFAVLDDHQRLRGIIIRGAVLAALSGNEVDA